MRILVLALAVFAGVKIWAQDRVYRAAAEDALVAAYRDRAIATCQKQTPPDARKRAETVTGQRWSNPSSVALVIGNSHIEVYLWEVDHELWNARYRDPYLVLTAGDGDRLLCTYDIGRSTAEVTHS